MKILIDTPVDDWSHLVAESIPALHEFANSIGVKRCWFENKRGRFQPHYDLKGKDIEKAIAAGAKQIGRKELHKFLKETYEPRI